MNEKESTFIALSALDMTEKHKEKNGMSYLPWSCAWTAVKTHDPLAKCAPVKTPEGCLYHTDGKTCWVETSMTIDGETQNETLAVMDHRNQSIPLDSVTSTAVNKSIKRCMVKNAALFGLDLNLWEGEELSDEAKRRQEEATLQDEAEAAALAELVKRITETGSKLIAAGATRNEVYDLVKQCAGDPNPANIRDASTANAVLTAMNAWLDAHASAGRGDPDAPATTKKSKTKKESKA